MMVKNVINATPTVDVFIHRGAPKAFVLRRKTNGLYQAFDATLVCTVTPPSGAAFTLGVGSGITLAPWNVVANALVSIKLTAVQSRLVPLGAFTTFEVQEGLSPNEAIVMMGKLTGIGGANAGD